MFESEKVNAKKQIEETQNIDQLLKTIGKIRNILWIYENLWYYKKSPSSEDKKLGKRYIDEDWRLITHKGYVESSINNVNKNIDEYKNESRSTQYRQGKMYSLEIAFSFLSLALDKTSEFTSSNEAFHCSYEELKMYWVRWIELEDTISHLRNNLAMAD